MFQPEETRAQDFLLQGWYWDYPKTANGFLWADTLRLKAQELADAGFTHVWLPPLSRASFGSFSNGYDPQDLFDLGEFGQGPTGFGSRANLDALITEFNNVGIKAVADVVYNHRDGGKPEDNPSVAGWIRNMTFTKIQNGDQPFPADRFRLVLPIGGATGFGAGTYFLKIASKSEHSNFFNKPYKVYVQTNAKGFQGLPADTESEPNGGGQCGEANDVMQLGVDMEATIDAVGCKIDEFALTLAAGDFNAAGDTLFIFLNNRNVGGLGDYSDHTITGLFYTGLAGDHEGLLAYQTFTDFRNMPSDRGDMNHPNFKPNGNPTQLSGDEDGMFFFYDYDQNVSATRDTLYEWTEWFWDDVGIRGFRMDAIKHFPRDFVGNLLDFLHDNNIDPDLVVGEFFDSNPALLNQWINDVLANMDTDTKNAISPRIFDFSLRSALKDASDTFGFDVRNVFNASMVDNQGTSPFNVVTFANNHDFRDPGQPVETDPILAYAYILTNNQVGLPSVFYFDYYNQGLKPQIDQLMQVHNDHITGASQRDYLSRFSTPYTQNFNSGFDNTTLFYQLSGTSGGRDILVAINYAGEALNVTHGVNVSTMNLAVGDTLTDLIGNAASPLMVVNGSGEVEFQLPPRSYSVWVQGKLLNDTATPNCRLISFVGSVLTGGVQDTESGLASITVVQTNNVSVNIPSFTSGTTSEVEVTVTITGANPFIAIQVTDVCGNSQVCDPVYTTLSTNLPESYRLEQNFPNPFNPSTTIHFGLAPKLGENTFVTLKIFDAAGQEVKTLISETMAPGEYSVEWDGRNNNNQKVAGGMYLYRLVSGNFVQTRKMVLLK